MDAGVPIKAPVAGIAMGLVKEGDRVAVLTDIQGMEDHLGDMDFKVAGTRKGVTALQMDIKIKGIDREILDQALQQAREARMEILDHMAKTLPKPRKELSPYAPKILTLRIHPDKIRDVIGPSGRVINRIIDETGVKIDIEQDGRIYIASTDPKQNEAAKKIIEDLVREVVVGEVYMGTVKRVEKYGAFRRGASRQGRLGPHFPAGLEPREQGVRRGQGGRHHHGEGDGDRRSGSDQFVPKGGSEGTVFGEIRPGKCPSHLYFSFHKKSGAIWLFFVFIKRLRLIPNPSAA